MTSENVPAADDLRPLLRRGLSVDAEAAEHLLALPGIVARSAGPDRASRIRAFNALLRQLIARVPDANLSLAAAVLFGDGPSGTGRTLTVRRESAAKVLGMHPDHFRKHLEPRILTQLAQALAADSARMRSDRIAPPQLVPMVAPPAQLPEDMFAWEAVEHEEHLSRLWAAVYALRAELLACERLSSMDRDGQQLLDAAQRSLWRWGQLQVAIREYRRTYGVRLLNADIAPGKLVGMAGWTPQLDPVDVEVVCHYGPDAEPLGPYLKHLTAHPAGQRLHDQWVAALRAPHETQSIYGSAA
jgi:hypothetical protein